MVLFKQQKLPFDEWHYCYDRYTVGIAGLAYWKTESLKLKCIFTGKINAYVLTNVFVNIDLNKDHNRMEINMTSLEGRL